MVLGALLLALSFQAEAQQTGKIPRIGFLPSIGDANNPGIQSGHSSKGCEISVISRGKAS